MSIDEALYKYAEFPDEFDRSRLKTAILKEIMEKLPKERPISFNSKDTPNRNNKAGWNDCLKEVKEVIEKVFK